MNIRTADNSSMALPFSANIIGGKSVAAADGRALDVICPSDGRPFAQIARSGPEDVARAVAAARTAFEGAWGRLTALERGRLLMKLGQAIADNAPELAALESRDTGKPLKQGAADMVAAARYFEFYGSAADKLHGDTLPFLNGYTVAIVNDPAWRHRPYHPVELSRADFRALDRRVAGLRQRLRGQAGRGRVPQPRSASPNLRAMSVSPTAR